MLHVSIGYPVGCMVNLVVWSLFILQSSVGDTSPTLTLCDTETYTAYGYTGSGTIVSSNRISIPRTPCSLKITACSRCHIQLNFTELSTNTAVVNHSTGSQCEYLHVSEPGYSELYRYVSPSNTIAGTIYISETRVVSIQYCGRIEFNDRFAIDFKVIEKNITISGQSADSGSFTSLGFPRGYGPDGDTFIYHLVNENPDGYIRLSFDDWHLSQYCGIRIILKTSSTDVRGTSKRPFIISDGPNMTVEVMFGTNVQEYAGFKARYEFVYTRSWSEKPIIVDEFYYSSLYGGQMECNCNKYMDNSWADMLWVIPRSALIGDSATLMLRLLQPTMLFGDSLEIRRGNSSNGELMTWRNPGDYFSTSGLYVRLRMHCNRFRSFRAVFAWQQPSYNFSTGRLLACAAPYDFRCAVKGYCIQSSLQCDGVDHCGDESDESHCINLASSTARIPSGCYAYFRCADGRQTICESKRCDGFANCRDSSDEHECDPNYHHDGDENPYRSYAMLATVVPVVLGSLITFIVIFTVIGFVVQRRRHRQAVNVVRQLVRERSALRNTTVDDNLPPGFSDAENDFGGLQQHLMNVTHITSPPSYDDTVIFNNVGFDASGTEAPPPYSIKEESSSTANSTTQSNELPLMPPSYGASVERIQTTSVDPAHEPATATESTEAVPSENHVTTD